MAEYNSDRTGANIDAVLDKADALTQQATGTATGVGIGTSSPTSLLTLGLDTFTAAAANTSAIYTDSSTGQTYLADAFSWNTRGGTERARIDSSGSFMVGTTDSDIGTRATGSGYSLYSIGQMQISAEGNFANAILNTHRDGEIIQFRKDGSTVGSIGVSSSRLYVGTDDTGLFTNSNSDAIQPFNTTTGTVRDGLIGLGTSGARFKDLYLSGGVYLGGTGAANKLDDYEEGTFTPTIHDATIGGNAGTASVAGGKYVKVGKVVCAHLRFQDINTTGMTGANAVAIKGLPFTATTNQPAARVGSYGTVNITLDTGTVNLGGYIYSDYIVLEQQSLTNLTTLKVIQISSSTGDIYMSVTYQTA